MDNLDKIFKAYDIRGIYPDEINEEVAYKIGRATAQFLKTKEILIGRDDRNSSDNLFKVVCEGVRDEGVDIIDIGLSSTPMFYFAVERLALKGGIMITASHNPPEYNGLKVVRDRAMPVGRDSGLEKIKKLTRKDKSKNKNRGEIESKEILEDYINHIINFTDTRRIKSLKIVIDTANGVAGIIPPELFKHIPADLVHIFADIDGSFPNHNPNPSNPENTRVLQKRAISEKADLGVTFDGDGDRILFINEKGERINPNFIFCLLIKNFYHNKGEILYDVISSRVVKEEIEETGNIAVCSKVGHTFFKEKMEKQEIIFGGESSGHYYFKENFFIESPFIVLLKVLEVLSRIKIPLSELIKPFEKYHLERINLKLKNVGHSTSHIMENIEKKYKKTGEISRLDGLTVEFKDWWFNFRPSHTESILRLTIEARTKELLEQKKKEILDLI